MCKRIICQGAFLHFFQILIFGVSSGAKKQKPAWNDKKLSVQTLHIWVSIHHMIMFFCCTSLKWWFFVFFIFFLIAILWVVRREEVKKVKNGPEWQKVMSHFISQELYLIWLWFLVHICKMVISPTNFFIFSEVWFFWFFKIH